MGITAQIVVRADSAYFSHKVVDACCKAGARFSLAVAVTKTIRAAIETIGPDVWTPIKYTDAVWDEEEERWISDAEIAEVPFTAFTSKKKAFHTTARLIVRRVKRLNPKTVPDGQSQLFAVWRHHVVFTDSVFVLTDAEPMHRAHAAVEQVFADLEDSALAHLPSGKFTANAAWLTLAAAAYNLTRRLPRLRLPCQSADRHHPTAPHPRTGPHRTPGTTDRAAPAPTLALGRRLLRPVDRHRTADAELTNPIPARPRSGRPRRTRHRQRPAGKPTCPEPKIHSETNHTAQSELTRWIEADGHAALQPQTGRFLSMDPMNGGSCNAAVGGVAGQDGGRGTGTGSSGARETGAAAGEDDQARRSRLAAQTARGEVHRPPVATPGRGTAGA
ncbi:transposase [Streptomyces halstedii]|uniref:Transposase n=2 Tax=Streptomyces halstedii TaxID=1944 RepID=A0A6N9UAL6_STRHA|nr:transposase [Streptomyces halstedii]